MYKHVFSTEEEFTDECPCAYGVLNFVNTVETDVRWWFSVAYYNDVSNFYSIIFKSYITDEYKDYVLSVQANYVYDKWVYKVYKKVDGLTK